MPQRPAFYFKSAVCTAWFRVRGIRSSLVACEGRLPVLYTTGTVQVGERLIVRCRTARCELGASTPGSHLEIGDRVFINQGASIVATCRVEIGNDTQIGDFAAVLDTNWHRLEPDRPARAAPVIIGANVWLGRNVIVLPGSEIGDHSVVAAGSIVKGYLPSRVLAAGNPARVVRELKIPDGWRRG